MSSNNRFTGGGGRERGGRDRDDERREEEEEAEEQVAPDGEPDPNPTPEEVEQRAEEAREELDLGPDGDFDPTPQVDDATSREDEVGDAAREFEREVRQERTLAPEDVAVRFDEDEQQLRAEFTESGEERLRKRRRSDIRREAAGDNQFDPSDFRVDLTGDDPTVQLRDEAREEAARKSIAEQLEDIRPLAEEAPDHPTPSEVEQVAEFGALADFDVDDLDVEVEGDRARVGPSEQAQRDALRERVAARDDRLEPADIVVEDTSDGVAARASEEALAEALRTDLAEQHDDVAPEDVEVTFEDGEVSASVDVEKETREEKFLNRIIPGDVDVDIPEIDTGIDISADPEMADIGDFDPTGDEPLIDLNLETTGIPDPRDVEVDDPRDLTVRDFTPTALDVALGFGAAAASDPAATRQTTETAIDTVDLVPELETSRSPGDFDRASRGGGGAVDRSRPAPETGPGPETALDEIEEEDILGDLVDFDLGLGTDRSPSDFDRAGSRTQPVNRSRPTPETGPGPSIDLDEIEQEDNLGDLLDGTILDVDVGVDRSPEDFDRAGSRGGGGAVDRSRPTPDTGPGPSIDLSQLEEESSPPAPTVESILDFDVGSLLDFDIDVGRDPGDFDRATAPDGPVDRSRPTPGTEPEGVDLDGLGADMDLDSFGDDLLEDIMDLNRFEVEADRDAAEGAAAAGGAVAAAPRGAPPGGATGVLVRRSPIGLGGRGAARTAGRVAIGTGAVATGAFLVDQGSELEVGRDRREVEEVGIGAVTLAEEEVEVPDMDIEEVGLGAVQPDTEVAVGRLPDEIRELSISGTAAEDELEDGAGEVADDSLVPDEFPLAGRDFARDERQEAADEVTPEDILGDLTASPVGQQRQREEISELLEEFEQAQQRRRRERALARERELAGFEEITEREQQRRRRAQELPLVNPPRDLFPTREFATGASAVVSQEIERMDEAMQRDVLEDSTVRSLEDVAAAQDTLVDPMAGVDQDQDAGVLEDVAPMQDVDVMQDTAQMEEAAAMEDLVSLEDFALETEFVEQPAAEEFVEPTVTVEEYVNEHVTEQARARARGGGLAALNIPLPDPAAGLGGPDPFDIVGERVEFGVRSSQQVDDIVEDVTTDDLTEDLDVVPDLTDGLDVDVGADVEVDMSGLEDFDPFDDF